VFESLSRYQLKALQKCKAFFVFINSRWAHIRRGGRVFFPIAIGKNTRYQLKATGIRGFFVLIHCIKIELLKLRQHNSAISSFKDEKALQK
jgi:hypothetical protein